MLSRTIGVQGPPERDAYSLASASGVGRCALLLVGAVALVFSTIGRAGVGDPGRVTYDINGVGVMGSGSGLQVPKQINYDPRTNQSEALALNLGQGGATSTLVTVSNLLLSESTGECGKWEAFDAAGTAVGSDSFIGRNQLTFDIEIAAGGKSFQYLVFTALPYGCAETQLSPLTDSSDYFVRQVTVGVGENQKNFPQGGSQTPGGWAELKLTGFDFGTPYLEGGRFIGAPSSTFEIDTENCTGGEEGDNNTDGCTIRLSNEFTTNISNSPDVKGTFTINPVLTLVDDRDYCRNAGAHPDVWDLDLAADGISGPIIPAYLCGIPAIVEGTDSKGIPYSIGDPIIRVLDIDSNLTAISSVLEHTVTEINSEFQCQSGQDILTSEDPKLERSMLPVIGWLPKNEGNEIPVVDSNGTRVTELQDITYGCGSARGGTSRYSYFVYNLRHREGAEYRAIVLNAMEQLGATLSQTSACLPGQGDFTALSNQLTSATRDFGNDRLSNAKGRLQQMLGKVESTELETRLGRCLYDLEGGDVFVGDPDANTLGYVVPRNFRGDLVVQLRHILYMYGRMLGVQPSNSDDF